MTPSRWLVISLALLLLVAPALAVSTYTWKDSSNNTIVVFNGTAGTTSWTSPTVPVNISYVVVAGGGSGGGIVSPAYGNGGGGGAGGVNASYTMALNGTYTITIGAGGVDSNGGNSSIGNVIVARGGGRGGNQFLSGNNGGSGGGGGPGNSGVTAGGTGTTGEGYAGGRGNVVDTYTGGGGGGASSVGGDAVFNTAGDGGTGYTSTLRGISEKFAGGGGGGVHWVFGRSPGLGTDGGGNGASASNGDPATTHGSGGGGAGGGGAYQGGNGMSGIIILKYFLATPVPSFTSNVTSGNVTLPVQFTDTSVLNPTAWNWSFTPVQGGNYSALQNPVYIFRNPGTFAVNLTVTNATGSASTTNNIVVGVPPVTVASFTKNLTTVYLPGGIQFTDTSTHAPTAWQWNYTKTGGVSTTFSTSQNPDYVFPTPGVYSIVLKATNYAGTSFSSGQNVIVNGFDAPRASYIITPSTGTPGALIMFNDTTVVGSTSGLVYNWSFGTGSVELNPFSDYQGSIGHVYNYGGVYNINLTVSNYNGTSFNFTNAGVTISTEQRMTNWYSPHQVRFRVLDANDNPIKAAYINATAYESSLPGGFAGAQQVLVEMYGINSISASQMVSSAVQMEGYTGDDGATSFTMHGNLKYLVYVTDTSGNTYTKTFYPQLDQYLIRVTSSGFTPPQDTTNVLATQGNATLTFSEPNTTWCTMGLDYMDITSKTTNVVFTAKLLNNQTVMNTQTTAVAGTQHILLNYTVPNVRGQQWIWYYNATVT